MFGGLNPKKMQAMMKKMGIAQQDIDAKRVIIEKGDGNIIIDNPSVIKINMQGQTNFQISGDIREEEGIKTEEDEEDEESEEDKQEQDIELIMEKTGCTKAQAEKVLKSCHGNVTEAILELSG